MTLSRWIYRFSIHVGHTLAKADLSLVLGHVDVATCIRLSTPQKLDQIFDALLVCDGHVVLFRHLTNGISLSDG